VLPGYVSSAELGEWYARAAIFAFPSLDEGFGMPVLEAMAAGVPVLTSNRSALPEVAGDAAVMVNPQDGEALAVELRNLTESDELRAALGKHGLERAQSFSWANAVEQTWEVYQNLLSGSRRPRQS
jgi:alpha-1,3-rhamnosyl/mannosyltransferase